MVTDKQVKKLFKYMSIIFSSTTSLSDEDRSPQPLSESSNSTKCIAISLAGSPVDL